MQKIFLIAVISVIFIVITSNFLSIDTETKIESCNISESYNRTGSSTSYGLGSGIGTYVIPPANITYGSASIKVPAVDENGNGVVTWLKVDLKAGEGRTLVNIDQLLFWVDTQYSIQTAKAVAENYTKMDLSGIDLVYSINTEASLIEGPSAGAALTVATIAALYNKTLNQTVMITGTINPDGNIGEVGGIVEKANAAKDIGATLFIVPEGQATQTYYRQVRRCERIGPINYCTTEYVPQTTNVEQQVGIQLEEASTIGEALKYFLV